VTESLPSLAHDSPSDPHLRHVVTDHGAELPILGIPVHFRSNERRVVELVEEAFGGWSSENLPPREAPAEEVRVTLVVHEGDEVGGGLPPLRYRYPDRRRILFTSPGSVGVADATRREVHAWVTPALVRSEHHFRSGVVEALTLAVLAHLDRTPLHSAAVLRDGCAVLLAGPSGVGKSTLSYAAVRAGWQLLAEDHVNVQLEPDLRVWGRSPFLHLPPEARRHFPELEGREPSLLHGGKEKVPVDVRRRGALAPESVVAGARARICVLGRRARPGPDEASGAPRLEAMDPDQVTEALPWGSEVGFDIFRHEIAAAVDRLARPGGWRLVLGGEPQDALPLLERIVDEVDGG